MIALRNIGNKKSICGVDGAIVIVGIFVGILGSASGEYESNGVENFGSRNLDGNDLCLGARCAERAGGVSGAMWFGPRLGRRRRSGEKIEAFDDDEIDAIADNLDVSPWILVPVQGASEKRQANQFTPRLGRTLGEELIQKYIFMGDNGRLASLMEGRDDMGSRNSVPPTPPPFAPRLGRRLPFTPSPRLGRRLRDLLQKL